MLCIVPNNRSFAASSSSCTQAKKTIDDDARADASNVGRQFSFDRVGDVGGFNSSTRCLADDDVLEVRRRSCDVCPVLC